MMTPGCMKKTLKLLLHIHYSLVVMRKEFFIMSKCKAITIFKEKDGAQHDHHNKNKVYFKGDLKYTFMYRKTPKNRSFGI